MARKKSGIKWGQYAFAADSALLRDFRKAVKAQGDTTSEVFSKCMRSYVKASERKVKRVVKKESAD